MPNLRIIFFVFSLLFVSQLFAQSNQSTFDIPIFAYHRFGDARYPSTNISDQVFEEQLQYLRDNNFEVISFGSAVKAWKEGRMLPEKAVILTIDDGYLSFYTHGWPLLKKYNFEATVFIQTETVGGGDFMSWNQIKEIQNAGIEIGNHSASHAYFLDLPAGEIAEAFEKDLEKSGSELKKHLGKTPKIYAYPSGEWTSEMEMIVKKSGYLAAAVQKSGVFCEKTNMMAVPRFPMGGNFGNLEGFKNKSKMKALRVIRTTPESSLYTENPPKLTVELNIKNIQINNIQFFVDGVKAEIAEINTTTVPPFVVLKAPGKIKGRHTLYTLTAPSTDGKSWHWFSYVWVTPADTK